MPDGIELAKAYVQIVPSAEGIQGKITEALGGEPAAAGDAAGQSLGAQLVGTLKGNRGCRHRQDHLGIHQPGRRAAAKPGRCGNAVQGQRRHR